MALLCLILMCPFALSSYEKEVDIDMDMDEIRYMPIIDNLNTAMLNVTIDIDDVIKKMNKEKMN